MLTDPNRTPQTTPPESVRPAKDAIGDAINVHGFDELSAASAKLLPPEGVLRPDGDGDSDDDDDSSSYSSWSEDESAHEAWTEDDEVRFASKFCYTFNT
jgi:hypothetical protein